MREIPIHSPYTKSEEWLREALELAEGKTPFPWQQELLRHFLEGRMEKHLDIPTGLGKTSVMAVWLVALASGVGLPRRLVYVVDRRAVVDQSTDVALRLRDYVEREPEIKGALGLPSRPLPISTLRGRFIDNREWLKDPTIPAIVVGTVDMIGSRLLFEGYGVSRRMRPYQAGLLGADVLLVVDEAHLVPAFERTLDAIATGNVAFGARDGASPFIPSFHLMTLTATAQSNCIAPFGLTPADFEHEVAKKRLGAKKELRLEALDDPMSQTLAQQAWKLADNGACSLRLIIFCDKPEDAEKAKTEIEKLAQGDKKQGLSPVEVDTELFTGGRRVLEREKAATWLKDRGFIAGSSGERPERPAFVFATSAGEVGIDLDADHMVCDLVAWERMVQRLGRVNRRGEGCANVTVVYEDQKPPAALQKAPEGRSSKERGGVEEYQRKVATMQAIKSLPQQQDGVFDASSGAIRRLRERATSEPDLQCTLEDATTKPPLRPALTRALVDAWSMTSLEKHAGRPNVQPWLRGWVEDPPQTTVAWRRHLPVRTRGPRATKQEIEKFFEAAPPHMSEGLETETFRVVEWLQKRAQASLKATDDQEAERIAGTEVAAIVLNAAGDLKKDYKLEDLDPSRTDSKKEALHRTLAGATLVVDARIAGLREGRLDDKAEDMPRTADDGDAWLESDGAPVTRFRVREVEDIGEAPSNGGWREGQRFVLESSDDGEGQRWLVVDKWRDNASTEDDRSAGPPQLLDEHQQWAERCAKRIAEKVGLARPYADLLATAARLHDEGKRARRWQQAFNAPSDGNIYAKTPGPINFKLLNGYRHEFGSLAYAENDGALANMPDDLRDLALHLIASHHGFARPLIRVDGCEDAPPSVLEGRAQEVAMRFARLQKRWGPWGLAWWEALLRAADWQASQENEDRDETASSREAS